MKLKQWKLCEYKDLKKMSRTDNLQAQPLFATTQQDGVHPSGVGRKARYPILTASDQGQNGQMLCTFQEKTRILIF